LRKLIRLAFLLPILASCVPDEGTVEHPGLEKELARLEYEQAADYYGAYIERIDEFPDLKERIPPEEMALVGYSYGQCLAELANALPVEQSPAAKSKASRLLEMAGDAFLLAAEQNLAEYVQPAVYSAVRVYKQALDLEGEGRSDLAEWALDACATYFDEKKARPEAFVLSEDDADIALVNVELLYRSGEDDRAEEFLGRFLTDYHPELDAEARSVSQASLLARLGDQTFDAGLYDKAREMYLRACDVVDPKKEPELTERWSSNSKVAQYHRALALEAEVPQIPAVFLDSASREKLDRALESYADLVERYPEHEVAVAALYRRGLIFQLWLNDPAAAGAEYARLASAYPDDDLAPAALFRAGLMAETAEGWPRAREYFRDLENRYDDSPEAQLVPLREAIHGDDADGLDRFIARHTDDPAFYIWVGEAYAALGLLAEGEGDADRALELYTRAVGEHSRKAVNRYGSPAVAHAYYVYGEHSFHEYMGVTVGGDLGEVKAQLERKTALMDRAALGFSGAASFGEPALVAEAQLKAAQVFEEFGEMLQDVVITGGASGDEIEKAYFAINDRTYFYLVAAREAYKTALASASLDPEGETCRLAGEGYRRLVEITGEDGSPK
jgi:tetratricopeptide (TPR) repeat protein